MVLVKREVRAQEGVEEGVEVEVEESKHSR
jgi:hypothetical protein